MRTPFRRYLVGVSAAVIMAATACGSDNGGGSGGLDDSADPSTQLVSSVSALNGETFRIEMSMGDLMTATGAIDAPGRTGQMAMTLGAEGQALEMEIIFTDADMWMNMGDLGTLMGAETPWMHVDVSQLGEDGFMGFAPGQVDFAGTAKMMQALGEVERVDDTTFRGEIDFSRAESGIVDEELLGGATVVPFTATLDDQGRLTQMEVELPETEGVPSTLVVRYFDFGAPVEVAPPPADEVSEMPAAFYESLNR